MKPIDRRFGAIEAVVAAREFSTEKIRGDFRKIQPQSGWFGLATPKNDLDDRFVYAASHSDLGDERLWRRRKLFSPNRCALS